ncbi:hypothetical protein HDV02_004233 [Globomyces sp. JEL0801]|nr:hypothetical protein HDV02_004233 [Globomyces sp. JEL0801]
MVALDEKENRGPSSLEHFMLPGGKNSWSTQLAMDGDPFWRAAHLKKYESRLALSKLYDEVEEGLRKQEEKLYACLTGTLSDVVKARLTWEQSSKKGDDEI